jgi:hypothetical protein
LKGPQRKALHVRVRGTDGQCFELYKDGTWASVAELLCPSREAAAENAEVNPERGQPAMTAGRSREVKASPDLASYQRSSGPFLRGPRGGCYTLTAGGKKRYVPRTYCE